MLVDPSKETLAAFMDRWLRDWAAINVGAKTLERYKELTSGHVEPHIGAVPIRNYSPCTWLNSTQSCSGKEAGSAANPITGLSPRTVGHVHRALHKLLKVAVEWGVIQRNVAEVVRPPKVHATELEILSVEQARTLIEKLKDRPLYPIVVLGLATGMRRGELLSLRWCDVDFAGRKLRVEQSLEQTKVGGLRFKAPKTKHGRRSISLAASVVAELRAHRKQQQEQRLRLGLGKASDDALVFPKWDGTPRVPTTTSTEWTRTLAQLGTPAGQSARIASHPCLTAHCLGHGRADHLTPPRAWLADDHPRRLWSPLWQRR